MSKITHYHGYYSLPVLAGSDNTRHPGELTVKIDGNRLVTAEGESLAIRSDTEVMGWGELDGLSYEVRVISTPTGAVSPWYVQINRDLLDQFAARHGVDLAVEVTA